MINNLHKFFIGLKSKYYLKKKLSECFKLFDSNKLNDASLLLKDIFSLGLDFSNNIIFINTVINYFEKNINNSKKKKILEWFFKTRDDFLYNSQHDFYIALMKSEYVGYPLSVHLETLALCNAKCTFCQYPELERVGDRMSDDTIAKVLDDLKIIPKTLPITIILYGVNEPFLDKRIFDIIKKIKLTLPNTYIQINSNGIPLNDSNLEKLKSSDITQMSISMNDYRKKEYEETMKIDYEKAIIVLEKLNKFKKNNVIPFPIGVTRAGDSSIHDIYFLKWVKDKFPYLNANCSPSFDWLGSKARFFKVPEIGCTHWFEVTIRANGDVAFCCLDGHIKYPKGNVINENVIDIYNKKESIQLRKTMTLRKNVLPCTQCRAG